VIAEHQAELAVWLAGRMLDALGDEHADQDGLAGYRSGAGLLMVTV
jgi:hypothetical protein